MHWLFFIGDIMIDKIKYIRYSQVFKDPFPDHSGFYKYDTLWRFFGVRKNEPEEVSIWAAYQMGYDKAYKEIEESLSGD